jgi:hypothetical protein
MIPTLISHNSSTTISFLPPTDFQRKQKENKKNNQILPATSDCCGAVVKNECRDHFSILLVQPPKRKAMAPPLVMNLIHVNNE